MNARNELLSIAFAVCWAAFAASAAPGTITTVAGGGTQITIPVITGTPNGVAIDANGNVFFLTTGNARIYWNEGVRGSKPNK